ncbi:MAG: pyridoxal phosphate-dependent aminotransferase [Syntrophomonadaceae bacterium]|nr:pyridoxal phosphate-dependent aminotransferase [Syntrophomonadaceae bacterium]
MKSNTLSLPGRTQQISPFIVMEVLEKAQQLEAQGEHIIHLEIGEPDFPTPQPIKEAAAHALMNGDTHYTHSLGKIALREAIAEHYFKKYRVHISPEQIIVTSGTSPGMLLAFSVLLEQGEEIILSDPYYACYPNFIRYLEGKPVFVKVTEEDGFKYRPEEIKKRISPLTRAIMVNSPANPTGTVYSARDFQALAALDQPIISDEIYNGLIYEGEEHSVLEFTDRAFVINGFSKLYAMTGWRLGYVIAPREYIRTMQIIQQNLFICAPSFVQTAAITALKDCEKEVAEMVNIYDQRRRYLLQRLKKMGIATLVDPTGAFYALAKVKQYSSDSYALAFEILEKAKVAVTPGIDFGSSCEGYLRISYANSLEKIKEGLDRLERFFAERSK